MEEGIFIFRLKKIAYPCCEAKYYGLIEFDHEKLEYVFSILSKIYGVSFRTADNRIENMRVTMSFINISINKILAIIAEACALSFKHENGNYEFYESKWT